MVLRVLPSTRRLTLPFQVTIDHEVIGGGGITTTEERRHGVLRLERDTLVVQWRVEREVHRVGPEIRSNVERAGMREATIALHALSDARVREHGRWRWKRWDFALIAADLAAFDRLASDDGFAFEHPAELVLPLRRQDLELAHEFASELKLTLAERALVDAERASALPPTDARMLPSTKPNEPLRD